MDVFRRISLRDPEAGTDLHLEVRGDSGAPLAQLPLPGVAPADVPVFRGTALLDGDLPIEALLPGEVLGLRATVPPQRVERPWTHLELRVVGGPAAGTVLPLPPGTHVLGRAGADLVVGDPFVSRTHARLEVEGSRVRITDGGSSNGTWLAGERVEQTVELPHGEVVRVGDSLLVVVPAAAPELSLVELGPGALGINRRFRPGLEPLPDEVAFPTPPRARERPGLNLLLVLLPAVAALVLALVIQQILILLFMALGPIMGLTSAISRRKTFDRETAQEARDYDEALAKATERLVALRTEEAARLRVLEPDPAAVVQCARANGRLLWARRHVDADFLSLRVGSGARRSAVRVTGADDPDPQLWQVPVTVPLRRARSLALAGDPARARGLARSLVLQAAVLHAPVELKVVVFGAQSAEDEWGWVRWLPHTRWSSDEEFVLVGSDDVSSELRAKELTELLKRRKEVRRQSKDATFTPEVLAVVDGLESVPAAALGTLLREGAEHGIHLVCLDPVQVPEGCNASVTLGGDPDATVVEQAGLPTQEAVLADALDVSLAEAAARCLAPLQLVGEELAGELPQQLRLLDLLDMGTPTPEAVLERWRTGSRKPHALVGLGEGGRPLVLDLTKDGPHGVVAGTSRSGKSEFLKTIIAALAAQNSPDDLSFVFIDFKGGNDYQVAAMLPHTVDLSTNLDPAGFERSLQLLDAEISRRTRLAATLRASTLEAYWAAQAKAPEPTPVLGRLLVVVDEFAELAQKSPEQLDRLVSVARVGAAYGVHLLLATQRPAGVVSGQIDANTPLRVCFRTTAREHSVDVLGVPDAGDIAERHRGRGFVRAHSAPPVEMQCARVGGARPGSAAAAAATPPRAEREDWSTIGHLPPADVAQGEVPDEETDFYDLALAIREAATRSGWTASAVPWPRPLPPLVAPSRLVPVAPAGKVAIPFALADDPAQQAHLPTSVVLGEGHVAVAGSPSTGRTTALRTFAAGVVEQLHSDEAHLYALDVGGGGLGGLSALPHCAGVASGDPALTERLLERLERELGTRRGLFEQVGASTLAEHNALAPRALPWLVLLVDGYEILHEEAQTSAGSAVLDRLLRLLSDGRRFGLQAVLAGDRWVATGKAGRLVTHRYALRFNERSDYDSVGLSSNAIPSGMPPGRAVDGDGRQVQIAALGDASGAGQAQALRELAERVRVRDAERARPTQTRALPTFLAYADALPDDLGALGIPVPVGMSAARSEPVVLDLAVEPRGLVVGGRRRSGRSTALLAMGLTALKAGVPVVAVVPKASPVGGLAEHGARVVAAGEPLGLPQGRVLLLVDDADLLDAGDPDLTAACTTPGVAMAVAGTTEFLKGQIIGWVPLVVRHKAGLVLCPESMFDGQLLGTANLPKGSLFSGPQGRAVLGVGGELDVVQLPLP